MLRCVIRNETDASVVQKTWLGKYKDGLIRPAPGKLVGASPAVVHRPHRAASQVLLRPHLGTTNSRSSNLPACSAIHAAHLDGHLDPVDLWIVLGNVPDTSSRHMASDLVP